jgi:hypothetical protein
LRLCCYASKIREESQEGSLRPVRPNPFFLARYYEEMREAEQQKVFLKQLVQKKEQISQV